MLGEAAYNRASEIALDKAAHGKANETMLGEATHYGVSKAALEVVAHDKKITGSEASNTASVKIHTKMGTWWRRVRGGIIQNGGRFKKLLLQFDIMTYLLTWCL